MNIPDEGLQYFVLKIDGREYGGWYRLIESDCLEVLAPGFFTIAVLDGESPQRVACRVFEQFVRVRLRQRAPLPETHGMPTPETPDHVCEEPIGSH